jgi:hypothetical protein
MSRKAIGRGRTNGTPAMAASMGVNSDNGSPASARSPHQPDSATAYAGNPLLSLVTRDDGWLRIVPARDSESVYIKWKFSRGPWSGHYVMTVVQYWQMGYGLALLVDKLDAADEGTFKPTKDTAYSD